MSRFAGPPSVFTSWIELGLGLGLGLDPGCNYRGAVFRITSWSGQPPSVFTSLL